ncbi:hypothetical protein [Maridesulfovibrio ferrireducens]|uniref:hypothetical protein n=1 Tax=Maridesulfovibrio ferrireducens TaxID=246191 RepID=UPI001A2CE344|nr:hypothetical protein [Maridesulfovibrio ferrireducens]MBI9110250.1 hypothetical protein [Maridesulfovibrio ferrireducens]
MPKKTPDLSFMLDKLPAIVSRDSIEALTGGLLTRSYMEKLDADGKGPKRFKSGRKIAYPSVELVAWIENRSQEML